MFEKLIGSTVLAWALVAPVAARAANPEAPAASLAKAGFDERNVDENALRYFAATGQAARLDAELRRLRSLYPNWTPPENIDQTPAGAVISGADEEDLWDLYGADKLDELRVAIDERRAAEPGWEPSSDLRAKFRAKLFRSEIVALEKGERFADIVQLVKTTGVKLDGLDVDLLWTVAEAFQKARLNAQALAIYKAILANHSDPALRLATVQKSMGFLRMDEVEQLLAMARKDSSGANEFAPIATDVARARISAFLHDERRQEVENDDLKVFGAYARTAKDPNQPALLAWYFYKLKNYSPALDWFKFALEHGGDAMVAHGLAHTLRFLGMKREAEEVAYAWREPLVNNSILFIDILETDLTKPIPPYIEPARLSRYGEVAMATASGQGAQALAWYAYNSCQFDVALQWFERAVAWHPKEPTVYGYALTLGRLKKRREEIELINRYDGLFPKAVEILFPDGRVHPPTPCEQTLQQARYTTAATASYPAGYPAGYAPYGMVQDPARQYAWGRVAGPGQGAAGPAVYDGMPRIARAEFPIRVASENPQRFAPTGQPLLVNAAVGETAPAQPGGFVREPIPGAFPLVARRVPGVGAMPYERYGFTLLPGYNGITSASSPTASEQIAPSGTLWSLEQRIERSLDNGAAPNGAPMTGPMIAPLAPRPDLPPAAGSPSAGAPPEAASPIKTDPTRPDPTRNG